MPECSTCTFDPCECCGDDFTVLEGGALETTLIASLTGCVDGIRDLYTCLGARPYQVNLIWTRWTGGARGSGAEDLVAVHRVLPTPLVDSMTRVRRDLKEIGTAEVGVMRVSEISPRFTEDTLVGNDLVVAPGEEFPKDVQFYWEIFFPRARVNGLRRRFTPKSAPSLDATNFEWKIDLLRASEDRTRAGGLR